MSQVHNNDFQDIVLNRRSIRNYDPSYEIEHSELLQIMMKLLKRVICQFTALAFCELKARRQSQLKPLIRFNTLQNETSSAMILIFGDLEVSRVCSRNLSRSSKSWIDATRSHGNN